MFCPLSQDGAVRAKHNRYKVYCICIIIYFHQQSAEFVLSYDFSVVAYFVTVKAAREEGEVAHARFLPVWQYLKENAVTVFLNLLQTLQTVGQ